MGPDGVRSDFYESRPPVRPVSLPPDVAVSLPPVEVVRGIDVPDFLLEAGRCFSCGSRFGCRRCWMYCTAGGFVAAARPTPGGYFTYLAKACRECGKCVGLCPCGFLEFGDGELAAAAAPCDATPAGAVPEAGAPIPGRAPFR